MRVKEAKDFLVEEIKRQAVMENVPLDEAEIEMLYFTEQGGLSGKMAELAEKFEESHNNAKYEKKTAVLMKHAYKRLKGDDKTAQENWDKAIRCLRRGDHYILVMWGGNSTTNSLIVLALGILVLALFAGMQWIGRTARPPNPAYLFTLFIGVIIWGLLFQKQVGTIFGWVVDNTIMRFFDPKNDKEE